MGGSSGGIDAVVARLDELIDEAIATSDRMGWFAAMYRRVTLAVRDGIDSGRFEDGDRMERFDVLFAERFIRAWDETAAGRRPTKSWRVAFDAAGKRRLVIVQQLLLGMNAHINLDLGIAAAKVVDERGEPIESLKTDFDAINEVLAELTDGFVSQVAQLSPWFALIDRVGGRSDDAVIRFNIDVARDQAWRFANDLATRSPIDQDPPIAARDAFTADLGRVISRPGLVLPAVLLLVRSREPNDVNVVTNFLRHPPPNA